jgi:hypothetical protein
LANSAHSNKPITFEPQFSSANQITNTLVIIIFLPAFDVIVTTNTTIMSDPSKQPTNNEQRLFEDLRAAKTSFQCTETKHLVWSTLIKAYVQKKLQTDNDPSLPPGIATVDSHLRLMIDAYDNGAIDKEFINHERTRILNEAFQDFTPKKPDATTPPEHINSQPHHPIKRSSNCLQEYEQHHNTTAAYPKAPIERPRKQRNLDKTSTAVPDESPTSSGTFQRKMPPILPTHTSPDPLLRQYFSRR